VKKFLKTLIKSILLALLVIMLIPMIYFTWRAGQPMELSEYNGLTYYQYIEWRKMAYEDSVTKYQTDHPTKVIKRPWSCIGSELFVQNTTGWYISGVILYAQDHPEITRTWTTEELEMIPGHNITWYNYLPELWRAHEHLIWSNAKHAPHLPSAYCRIQPDVPTLEEFQAMKVERELSVATR
jgi:hypothetical protein